MFPVRAGLQVLVAVSCLSLLGYIYMYNITDVNEAARHFRSRDNRSDVINDEMKTIPLLTLFTTWPEGGNKQNVWNTTLKNWSRYKPLVRPVFFKANGRHTTDFVKHGWDVLPISKTSTSGLPVLKYMFLDAKTYFNSTFYGFSNGDIIFDDGLITTLRSVVNSGLLTKKPVLITGIRTNVADLTEKETADLKILAKVARKRGKLFIPLSEDYFITDESYPWADIPELVIARRAYDNWLVLNARQQNHTVIDATETLMAIHQTTKAGNHESWKNSDSDYNLRLLSKIYKSVHYGDGATVCASWKTIGGGHTNISLIKRKRLTELCYR